MSKYAKAPEDFKRRLEYAAKAPVAIMARSDGEPQAVDART